jgi:hypothetical protein
MVLGSGTTVTAKAWRSVGAAGTLSYRFRGPPVEADRHKEEAKSTVSTKKSTV